MVLHEIAQHIISEMSWNYLIKLSQEFPTEVSKVKVTFMFFFKLSVKVTLP